MAGGNVADLMAQHSRQLGFIVHQRNKLPGRVDVAARDRESVVDTGIHQPDLKILACIAEARLHRDVLADLLHIVGMAAGHAAAEFCQQLRIGLCALLCLGLADWRIGAGYVSAADSGTTAQRKCECGAGCQRREFRGDPFRQFCLGEAHRYFPP